MAIVIAMSILFGLLLALAQQRFRSGFRPRGRFAPSVAWGRLPALPRPELAARTRTRSDRPAQAGA
jgi:hypothetical protein